MFHVKRVARFGALFFALNLGFASAQQMPPGPPQGRPPQAAPSEADLTEQQLLAEHKLYDELERRSYLKEQQMQAEMARLQKNWSDYSKPLWEIPAPAAAAAAPAEPRHD